MESKIRRMETVDEKVAEILRSKTPTERLAMANAMWKFAWQMTRAIAVREDPDWPADEIDRHVAQRMSHGAF